MGGGRVGGCGGWMVDVCTCFAEEETTEREARHKTVDGEEEEEGSEAFENLRPHLQAF